MSDARTPPAQTSNSANTSAGNGAAPAAKPANNRRPSMLNQVEPWAPQRTQAPMKSSDGQITNWRSFRTAYQQFMRENEPLFRALAASVENPYALLEGGGFAQAAATAKAIAVQAAQAAMSPGQSEPVTSQIRPFRTPAAMIAAAAWQRGNLQTLDTAAIGLELGRACAVVDAALDRGVFSEITISDQSSLNMSAMAVSLRLLEPVMTYDFRKDRSQLVAKMTLAVIDKAADVAGDLVPEEAGLEERRTLVQTLSSCLASIMSQVYEQKAQHFVGHVVTLSPAEGESFARAYDPMPDILTAFEANAEVYAGAAYASARLISEAAGMASDQGNTLP